MADPDLQEYIRQARERMPMDRLFGNYGMGEFADKAAAKRLHCPYCDGLGTFSAHYMASKSCWTYRCFRPECRASKENRAGGGPGGDEIGFVHLQENLGSRKAAMLRYFEIAGVEMKKREPQTAAASGTARPPEESPDGEPPDDASHAEADAAAQAQSAPDGKIVAFQPERGGGTGTAHPADPQAGHPPKPPQRGSRTGWGSDDIASVWEAFHGMLELRDKDRAEIRSKRGLSDRVIDTLKIRSNTLANAAALAAMREKFDMRLLLKAGLFKLNSAGKPIPEEQFTGQGPVKQPRGADGKKQKDRWEQVERPLIPYLNHAGRIITMRPHKGNIGHDKDDDESCGGHVYCPFLLTRLIQAFDGTLVLTEGEWKAAALYACGIPALAMPGMTFVRNPVFRQELVDILCRFDVREVVLVFDNDEKGIHGLPNYKEDPWERYDVAVWSLYIAWDLMKRAPKPPSLGSVRIGMLPDEWRMGADGRDTGKTDWDSALADFMRRSPSTGLNQATAAFRRVVEDAVPPDEFVERFHRKEAHPIIKKQLGDLWHVPLLPKGGRKEERLAAKLDRIGPGSPTDLVFTARAFSRALKGCIGTYYERKEPSEKRMTALKKMKEGINKKIEALEDAGTSEADAQVRIHKLERTLIQELMEGTPESISNFTVKCDYCLHTVDGVTQRMVNFRDTMGRETGQIPLPGEVMARAADLRIFCNQKTKGIASWRGGDKHTQMLNEDMVNASAYRDIFEVDAWGMEPKTGIWFFGDSAFHEGKAIMPDEHGVYWHQGSGYRIDSGAGADGGGFVQGAPMLMTGSLARMEGPTCPTDDQPGRLRWLFSSFQTELFTTVGDWDGMYSLGMSLSYAIGPELFTDRGLAPGLWMYGKRGSGKTTLARWFLRIWGFPELKGILINKGTTPVAMARILNQYSFLPVWFDEFRRNMEDVELKEGVLRGAFDRSSSAKGMMNQSNRTRQVMTRTTPIVSGESSSSDSATRSRYGHILISAARRSKHGEKQRYETMQRMSRHLHHVGRFLMENRPRFVERTLEVLDRWLDDRDVRAGIDDERTRVVHGVGVCCLAVLNEMLGVWPNIDNALKQDGAGWKIDMKFPMFGQFSEYMVNYSRQALSDVQEETMANQFWTSLISGVQREEIPKNLFLIAEVLRNEDGSLREYKKQAVLGESNKGAPRKVLFLQAKTVYDLYEQDVSRRSRTGPALSYNDILRELSKEECWVPPPDNSTRIHRIYMNGRRVHVWGIYLDRFSYGQDFMDLLGEAAADGPSMFASPSPDGVIVPVCAD